MKHTLIFFTAILPFMALSQNQKSIEIYGDFNFANITEYHASPFNAGKLSSDFGLTVSGALGKGNFSWVGGLQATSFGAKAIYNEPEVITDNNGNEVTVISAVDYTVKEFKFSELFLEAPLGLRYDFFKGKMSSYMQLTVSPAYLLSGRADRYLEYDDGREEKESSNYNFKLGIFKRYHIHTGIAIGLQFSLSEKVNLICATHGNVQVHTFGVDHDNKGYYFAAGLRAGLRFDL